MATDVAPLPARLYTFRLPPPAFPLTLPAFPTPARPVIDLLFCLAYHLRRSSHDTASLT